MDVELVVIPGCPGAAEAAHLLRAALDDVGPTDTPFAVVTVDTEEAARERGFAGSPAFVVDGVDLFAAGGGTGDLACRVYRTPDGLRNVPAAAELRAALRERLGQGGGVGRSS